MPHEPATHCKIPAHSFLTLDICDIESLAVVPMLSCVTGYSSLHLNALFLTNLGALKDEGVLNFLAHAPDIQIGHLSLCNITCSKVSKSVGFHFLWLEFECSGVLSLWYWLARSSSPDNPGTAQTAVTSNTALIHSLWWHTWEASRVRSTSTVWYNFFTPRPPWTLFEHK